MFVVFATSAVLLLAASVWLGYANLIEVRASATRGDKVRQAQLATEAVLSTLKDAETWQRGFLLTGRPAYLEPYEAARAWLGADFAGLEQAPFSDASRTAGMARLRGLAAAMMSILGETIAPRREGQPEAALALLQTDRGKQYMDLIRAECDGLERELDAKLAEVQARGHSTWFWIGPAGLGMMASLLIAGIALEQHRVRRVIAGNLAQIDRFSRAFGLAQGMLRGMDGQITFWKGGAAQLYGYTASEALGRSSHELLRTRFRQPLADIEGALLRDGQWQGELVHRRRDGVEMTVLSRWVLDRGKAGEADAVIEVNTDISAQKRAEESRERDAALLRTVVEAAPGLIYAKDREGRMRLANPATLDVINKSWSAVEGHTDAEFLDDPVQGRAIVATDHRIMENGVAEEVEEIAGGQPGQRPRVWLSTKTPMRGLDGQVIGLVGVSVEITDRKEAEERRRLLVNELNHRVKNTLATVQAIASQTLRGTDPAVRYTLEARLLALASAHDVLTAESWTGASLHDVIAGVLAPHGGAGDYRFHVSGISIRLVPRAALALALALHELVTNALKYGALSAEGGHVEIHWKIAPESPSIFRLTWTERGGPVVAPPTRRGFGTRLIERSLTLDLGGTAGIAFDPDGVTCVVEAPLAELAARAEVMPFPQVGMLQRGRV